MRGMPELSEAILYTHLSANRSSEGRQPEKGRTVENQQNDKDREYENEEDGGETKEKTTR